jgi:hypothetical protein
MERPKPKQADPIGKGVQLDQAVVESMALVLMILLLDVSPNCWRRTSAEMYSAFGDALRSESVGGYSQDRGPIGGWHDGRVLQEGMYVIGVAPSYIDCWLGCVWLRRC